MQPCVAEWIRESLARHVEVAGEALEVGSRDVNGALRSVIAEPRFKYTGIDISAGANVDHVCDVRDFEPRQKYDLVVCVDTLEHDPRPWEVVERCRDLLALDGLLVLAAPFVWPVHDHPRDYYRFTQEVFLDVFLRGLRCVKVQGAGRGNNQEVLGRGVK